MTFTWGTVTAVTPLRVQLDGDTAPLPFTPDSLVDPSTLAVADRVRVELSGRRVVIHGRSGGGGDDQPGDIKMTARATAYSGWMLCRGQSLLRSSYPALFSAIGITYGAADSAHFYLPSPPGRSVVGLDLNQMEFNALGKTGGEKTHLLTSAESGLRDHTHQLTLGTGASVGGTGDKAARSADIGDPQFRTAGSSSGSPYGSPMLGDASAQSAHNNLPPYIVFNFVIKY